MKQLVVTGGQGVLAQAILNAFPGVPESGWKADAPGRGELDVSDAESIRRYFAGRETDLLVCCAGLIRDAPLLATAEADWNKVFTTNYHGAAACAEAVLPGMTVRRGGHIIFISSRSAVHPPAGQIAYATAKAALLGLNSSLAKNHGKDGIRVNAILPGFLETPMTAEVSAKRRGAILADHALPLFNTPAAVASFIRHLQDHLPHTSGQVFHLDSRPG